MKINTFTKLLFGVFCLVQFLPTNALAWDKSAFDKAYFFGPTLSYNLRSGYYDFSDIQKSSITPRSGLLMYGATCGKRFPITTFMRLQIGFSGDLGSVVDDTISATLVGRVGPSAIGVTHTFYHAAFSPELQLYAPMTHWATPFARIGAGLDYTKGKEQMFVLNSDTLVTGITKHIAYNNTWSFDAMVGCGLDFLISRSMQLSVSYSFRSVQPIQGASIADFPLTPVDYHEVFFCHGIQATMLFSIN